VTPKKTAGSRQMRRLPAIESGFPRHAPEAEERENGIFPRHDWKKNTSGIHIMAEKKENKKIVTFLCHVFLVFTFNMVNLLTKNCKATKNLFYTALTFPGGCSNPCSASRASNSPRSWTPKRLYRSANMFLTRP
jgi:hypothetical protein